MPANNYSVSPLVLMNGATPFSGASAAGTYVSNDIPNLSHSGIKVALNISAFVGTPTVQLFIEGKDPSSGAYYSILADPTSPVAASVAEAVFTVYPGITPVAPGATLVSAAVSDVIPPTFRIRLVIAGVTSVTGTIDLSFIY